MKASPELSKFLGYLPERLECDIALCENIEALVVTAWDKELVQPADTNQFLNAVETLVMVFRKDLGRVRSVIVETVKGE